MSGPDIFIFRMFRRCCSRAGFKTGLSTDYEASRGFKKELSPESWFYRAIVESAPQKLRPATFRASESAGRELVTLPSSCSHLTGQSITTPESSFFKTDASVRWEQRVPSSDHDAPSSFDFWRQGRWSLPQLPQGRVRRVL